MIGLNRTFRRGRWYVYHRKTPVCVVRGFDGTRAELYAHIETQIPQIERKLFEFDQRHKSKTPGWRMDAAKQLDFVTRRRAVGRKIPYTLSRGWIYERIEANTDKCEVSGLEFDFLPKDKNRNWHRRPLAPSLDRLDNSLGYEPENVRIVAVCVNIAINEWGVELFDKVCRSYLEKQSVDVLQK